MHGTRRSQTTEQIAAVDAFFIVASDSTGGAGLVARGVVTSAAIRGVLPGGQLHRCLIPPLRFKVTSQHARLSYQVHRTV